MSKFSLLCIALLTSIVVTFIVAVGVMLCWNLAVVAMFEAAPVMTYWQAVGITCLASLLIGIGSNHSNKSNDD